MHFVSGRIYDPLYLVYNQIMPILTVSALEKKRVTNIFPLIDDIITERKKRIPTAELNYITQVRIEPPSFTVFIN